jgi:hypothetical protein
MTQTSWPFSNIDTSVTQFSQWSRNIGEGVKGSSATTDLKPYGDSTGMQVKVYAGQAMVRGHYFNSDATVTLAVTAAHATLARIDSVVLQLDPSANSIVLAVVAGTPSATPVAPTLTQTDAAVYQLQLGQISVAAAASTIAAGNVSDLRPFLGYLTAASTATLTNKTLVSPQEVTTVSATAATGTVNYDAMTQADLYYTTSASANFTLNFRGNASTTMATWLAVGQTQTVVFRNTNGATAYYATGVSIDGTALTAGTNLFWQGGTAPTAGNASAKDVYSFAITKTASTPTYQVFASVVKFA